MSRELIRVKLNARDYTELFRLYEGLWANYEPSNAHELLLKAHITDLYEHLEFRVTMQKKTYALVFNGTEALAFVQLWEPAKRPLSPLQAQVVQSIFLELNRVMTNRRFTHIMNPMIDRV